MGGDEFAVLLTEHSDPDIENIARNNIIRNLTQHNEKRIRDYELSLSIGIAHFDPDHYSSLEDVITAADASMYKNKKSKVR